MIHIFGLKLQEIQHHAKYGDPNLVVGGRWMIGRLMDDRRRRWRRCMVEASTNMSVSVVTTVVRHGEEQRREEDKKLK